MSNPPVLRGGVNNVATQVKPCEPWTFEPNIPATATVDKKTYKAWRAHPQTKHLVFTGYEGVNPDIRVNAKTNPVRRMSAIVVDYDTKVNDNAFETVLDRCPSDLQPSYISRSPHGGARLVYLFEESVPVDCEPLLDAFLEVAKNTLDLTNIFPKMDTAAWSNISTLYDVGNQWRKLGEQVLPKNTVNYWFTLASKKTAWSKLNEVHIPLDTIREEMEQRGWTWEGEFVEGARGAAFWAGGVNPTSCIVTEAGMICFSMAKQFYPWAEIFGGSFVRQFQADKIGAAIDGCWYDGKQYYRKLNDRMQAIAKEDYARFLMSRKNLSDERHGKASSELNDALVNVQEMRRVQGAIPALFDPRDVIERDGERLLNISYVRAMAPADELGEWGEKFPWIANYLDNLFDPIAGPIRQLDYFLAWTKRFYGSARQGSLERGHNCFVVGPADTGKTLLGLRIIGALVGGSADASDFVVKGSEFNKNLVEKALWRIDDGQVAADVNAHRKFSEMVKKLAANPTLNYRKMYSDSMNNEWAGRLFVTLNDDNYSLQMIPDLTMSIEDKIMIFKAKGGMEFPPRHILETTITAEMPHLARWILEMKVPKAILGKSRFGIKSYIHEGLRSAALHSGQVGDLLELVEMWIKTTRPMERLNKKHWEGTASEWWAEAMTVDLMKPLVQKFSTRQVGRKFSEASRIPGSRITVLSNDGNHGHRYRIWLNGLENMPSKSESGFNPVEP